MAVFSQAISLNYVKSVVPAGGTGDFGSVAKRCGHSLYTIPNILAFDFSVLFVGYSLIGNISLTFFVAQRTKRPAREKNQSLGSLFTSPKGEPSVEPPLPCLSFSHLQGAAELNVI